MIVIAMPSYHLHTKPRICRTSQRPKRPEGPKSRDDGFFQGWRSMLLGRACHFMGPEPRTPPFLPRYRPVYLPPSHGSRPPCEQDPVHGLIRLNAACIDIMDSQPFQRLRDLKQLGTTQCVPCPLID